MVIDAHTHTFPEKIAAKVVDSLQKKAETRAYTEATEASLIRSMKEAEIDVSVLLPVMTNPQQVVKLNDLAAAKNELFQETKLFSLGGMHPDYEDYREELARIRKNGITGIKLHPAYQGCDLDDIRMMRIIERAAELDLAVVIHAGWDIGYPEHNYSDVRQICTVLKEINPDKFVLAHMGGWKDWDEVEKTLAGTSVYMDTAFVLGKYEPPTGFTVSEEKRKMLSDEQFIRIVNRHGEDQILFGTDSPWGDQKNTLQHIKRLIPDGKMQEKILWKNATDVFCIPNA